MATEKIHNSAEISHRHRFKMDSPCRERLDSAHDFPELHGLTYSERISEMAGWMKALRGNEKLQSEFVSVLRGPHRDLMGLSHELHEVQQKLRRGCDDVRGSKSLFHELLAHLSPQSVCDEIQALITATELFRELLPAAVDWVLSVESEEISNLFILFKQIQLSCSAHTFPEPAPCESDSVYCQLLSRIGFTNYRGHLMYQGQTGFCGLDMITITIAAIQSVSQRHTH